MCFPSLLLASRMGDCTFRRCYELLFRHPQWSLIIEECPKSSPESKSIEELPLAALQKQHVEGHSIAADMATLWKCSLLHGARFSLVSRDKDVQCFLSCLDSDKISWDIGYAS